MSTSRLAVGPLVAGWLAAAWAFDGLAVRLGADYARGHRVLGRRGLGGALGDRVFCDRVLGERAHGGPNLDGLSHRSLVHRRGRGRLDRLGDDLGLRVLLLPCPLPHDVRRRLRELLYGLRHRLLNGLRYGRLPRRLLRSLGDGLGNRHRLLVRSFRLRRLGSREGRGGGRRGDRRRRGHPSGIGRRARFDASREQQPEERPLHVPRIEGDELEHLARRGEPVDAREQVALGQREGPLVGERDRRDQQLVEVADRLEHRLVVAHLPDGLEDQGLRHDGDGHQPHGRRGAVVEAHGPHVLGQARDQPFAQARRGERRRRGGVRLARRFRGLAHPDLGQHALEPQLDRVARLRKLRGLGFGSGRAERHDLAGLEPHVDRVLALADDENARSPRAERFGEQCQAIARR